MIAKKGRYRCFCSESFMQTDVFWEFEERSVKIIYKDLTFEGEPTSCSAEVLISEAKGDEFLFSLKIVNEAPMQIHKVQFPVLPGFSNKEGESSVKIIAGAKWEWSVGRLPVFGKPAYCKQYQQVSTGYPGADMYFPWADFSEGESGLSLINYMHRPYLGGLAGINLRGHERGNLEAYWWRNYPWIWQGEKWESPQIGIGIHSGDWHHTAAKYYDWFIQNVGVTVSQSEKLRISFGLQNIMLSSFDGRFYNKTESIPEHARVGRKYGIDHLVIWDSLILGMYCFTEPESELLDYGAEELVKMQDSIAIAKEEGTVVSALMNVRHINVNSNLYEEYKEDAVLCMDGTEYRENWLACDGTSEMMTKHLGGNCILLSPRSERTQKRIHRLLDKYLSVGFNALNYDQPFILYPDYNPRFGKDYRPDDASYYCYDLIAQLRKRILKQARISFDVYVVI